MTRLQTMIDARETEGEDSMLYDGQRIMTPHEVAYVLDTSTTTVSALVKRGRLRSHNFGKVVRFLEGDVLELLGVVHEAA
jgi:excisionase family DNA binding protein